MLPKFDPCATLNIVPPSLKAMARHDVRRLLCALLLIASSAFAQTQTTGRQELSGHIPEAIKRLNLQPLRSAPSTNILHLAIGLPLRNQAALNQLLQQIYNPSSPNFRRYLTPAEFAAQFGPTVADYQAVINFAQANGLTVTGQHANRALLDVGGTVANIEKAFNITLQVYSHPTEQRTFYAPSVEPSVTLTTAVLHISGPG